MEEKDMSEKKFNKKWLIPLGLIAGAALVGSGVFASSQITLNSGNSVSLGAGAAAVNVCGSSATISAQQYFDSTQQAYYTGTISLANLDSTACNGKTLNMAFKDAGGTVRTATWAIASTYTTYEWAYTVGSDGTPSGTRYSNSTLAAFNTAQNSLSTIAISVS
jgi:hypothetical protein